MCAIVAVDTVFFSALTPLLPHYTAVAGLSKAGAGLLSNLAWAAGQAIAAAGSGALAQATSDLVPYGLLSIACLATLADLLRRVRGSAASSANG